MSSETELLKRLQLSQFEPVSWARKGLQQSLAAYYYPYNPILDNSDERHIELADGDKLFTVFNFPKDPNTMRRIVVLLHGLSGSYCSKYMIRISQKLNRLGIGSVRVNLRGTGKGRNLAKKLYHAGISEDPASVCQYLEKHYPNIPVTLVGFSLGANIALKLVGEHKHLIGNLDSLVAVSPPMELLSCVNLLSKIDNRFLDYHFSKSLVAEVEKISLAQGIAQPFFPSKLTVYEFDELYTAPANGFSNAIHYYNECSAIHYLQGIHVPVFILHAEDDPLIAKHNFKNLPEKSNFDVLVTKHGGHVGWLARGAERWMDQAVVNWINLLPK